MECCCCCGGPLYIATTPTHTFEFPIDPDELDAILITYAQGDSIVLEKHKEDLEFVEVVCADGSTAYYGELTLTQSETKQFDPDIGKYSLQVRVLTVDGESAASPERFYSVAPVRNSEVLE